MVKISEILLSGNPVKVDLLTEFPLDSDPSTWKKPTWTGYDSAWSFPALTSRSDNSWLGVLQCQFRVDPAVFANVVAVGVTYDGQNLFVGNFRPTIGAIPSTVDVKVEFVIQPWEQ